MRSVALPIILRFYDILFKFVDHEWFFDQLGKSKVIHKYNALRLRFTTEAYRCFNRYGVGSRERFVTTANGLKFSCDLRDVIQLNLYYFKEFSREEQEIVAKYLAPGGVFIDVGANIGVFSLMAAKAMGSSGRVIAVEPASDTMATLRRNATMNALENRIQFLQCALSNQDGELTLYDSQDFPNDLGLRSLYRSGNVVETVPVRVFDQLVAQGDVIIDRPLTAIKIDVEGAELKVLEGMKHTISTHQPKLIMFEVNRQMLDASGSSAADLEQFMKHMGYHRLGGGSSEQSLSDAAWVRE